MENKRMRDDEAESLEPPPTEAKRLRAAAILEILDGDDDGDGDEEGAGVTGGGGDPFPASDDLATVMRSLEQEIALVAPAPVPPPPPELGYLLEASDDDLGIPPPAAEKGRMSEELEAAAALWFPDDEMPMPSGYCYDELGFEFFRYGEDDGGAAPEEAEGVPFDGAPFDYAQDQVWAV